MNRIFSVAALAAMVALAGCGKNEDTSASSSSTASTPPPASTAPAASPAPATDTTAASSAASAPAAGTAPAAGDAAPATGATTVAAGGQETYAKTCVACHGAGVAGAPKLGDKADWGPRIAKGKDTLYTHAIQGFTGAKGVMPPKGGMTALSDDEVKAAVDYMVAQAS